MKSKLALCTMLAVALVAPAALPCGAPFGNGINVDPKQDIVVVHKNGTETYVFQPRFCGSAQEFGLVLPVPAKLSKQPELSKAEVFTKLNDVSRPQYVTSTQCGSGTGGSRSTGVSSTGGSGTTVVSSGSVGFMDYAQIETSSLDALTAWLDANGYPYDSQAESAFDYYVKKSWLFLTFKVSQGELSGTTTCKDLGPVRFSFPTEIPVVPTRMATARSKDNTGVLSYATKFSWNVFGISTGSQQVGFASGTSSTRELKFSGLLAQTDIGSLDGLAVAGDRADKLSITFYYGSSDPDVGLSLVAGEDYREVINQVTYVRCEDGGTDSAVALPPADAARDTAPRPDVGPFSDAPLVTPDAIVLPPADVAPPGRDTAVVQVPPESGKADAGVVAAADAAPSASKDAATTQPPEQPAEESSGCSCAVSSSSSGGVLPLLVVALLLALPRRRR
jgi:MYXO-CTERM domain-containing protein